MSQELTLNESHPLVVGGWLDERLLDLVKNIFKNQAAITWPGDKVALRAFVIAGATWAKSLVKLPADIDDMLIDQLADMVYRFIDSASLVPAPAAPSGPMIVGATIYTKADAVSFLSSFPAGSISAAARQKIEENPKVLESLKRLSPEHQQAVMQDTGLLDLLIKWGPVILQIVMMLITIV